MNETAVLFSILLAQLLGAMSPGPSFILLARTSASQGRGAGVATAFGLGIGAATFGLLALLGLHVVLSQVAWLYGALKLVGGAYLIYLAWRMWRGARHPIAMDSNEGKPAASGLLRAFARGLGVQLSNPKTAIAFAGIFAALMPGQPPTWMVIVLPPLFFLQEVVWSTIVAVVFSSPKPRAAYLRGKAWVDRSAGTLLGVLGLRLMWTATR